MEAPPKVQPLTYNRNGIPPSSKELKNLYSLVALLYTSTWMCQRQKYPLRRWYSGTNCIKICIVVLQKILPSYNLLPFITLASMLYRSIPALPVPRALYLVGHFLTFFVPEVGHYFVYPWVFDSLEILTSKYCLFV